jgi:hypothetical protein
VGLPLFFYPCYRSFVILYLIYAHTSDANTRNRNNNNAENNNGENNQGDNLPSPPLPTLKQVLTMQAQML